MHLVLGNVVGGISIWFGCKLEKNQSISETSYGIKYATAFTACYVSFRLVGPNRH